MAIRKTKIEKLFDKRKATYEKQTAAIILSIDGVIDGLKLYASSEGLLTEDNSLEILATSVDAETKFVYIVGALQPNIGASVVGLDGEIIAIETEQDQALFAKTIQINIAPDIIEANDPDITLEYIELANANMNKLRQEMEALEDAEIADDAPSFADFAETTPVLSEQDKKNDELMRKILEGAENPSGLFN